MHTADEKKYPNARVLGTYQNLIINDGDLSLSYLWYKKMVDVLFWWFLMEVQNAPKGFFALAWLDRIKKDWQSLKENVEIPFPDSIQIE